jgi:HD superfamily phosphohydrolase
MSSSLIINDVLYGSIKFTPLLQKIIDSPYFQRLGYLHQLGMCHLVYPGATHTRKSHSLGVSHLAGLWMTHLQQLQPELHITPRMIELVRIAGLLHDVGHTMFSHLFDHDIAPLLNIQHKDHEERSILLLNVINQEQQLGLTEKEVNVISNMIKGTSTSSYPKYMFQIVSSVIDVDKMDYLRRDSYYTAVPCGFQYDRIINNSRVIDGELCFHEKVAKNILQMLHTRYYFYSEIYHHKTCMVLDVMMRDAIIAALPFLPIETYFQDETKWCTLNDHSIITMIKTCPEATQAQDILKRIETRNLYNKRVSNNERVSNKKKVVLKNPLIPNSEPNTKSVNVGYHNRNTNPLLDLWFFRGDCNSQKFKLVDFGPVVPSNFLSTRSLVVDECEIPERSQRHSDVDKVEKHLFSDKEEQF